MHTGVERRQGCEEEHADLEAPGREDKAEHVNQIKVMEEKRTMANTSKINF